MLTILSVSLEILTCYCVLFGLPLAMFGWLVRSLLPVNVCVLSSTSRAVIKDMKDWVLSQEGDRWSVNFDVQDLGGSLGYHRSRIVCNLGCQGSLGSCSAGSYLCSSLGFSW